MDVLIIGTTAAVIGVLLVVVLGSLLLKDRIAPVEGSHAQDDADESSHR